MSDAIQRRESVDFILDSKDKILAKINGSRIIFNGFLEVYNAKNNIEKDSEDLDDDDSILPDLNEGDLLNVNEIHKKQHFTMPPPRFTEASLIKNLEELGIGRPSTYASIISVLQDRNYVVIEKRQFKPQPLGIGVSYFLRSFFTQYVAYDFTAKIEEELDEIAEGKIKRIQFLDKFWKPFSQKTAEAMELKFENILEELSKFIMPFFFKKEEDQKCKLCESGRLIARIGKFGLFFSCSNYPECKNIISLNSFAQEGSIELEGEDAKDKSSSAGNAIIEFEKSGFSFKYKIGKYGPYIEKQDLGSKIKVNFSLPKTIKKDDLNEEIITFYTTLPIKIGEKDKKEVKVGIGKFGYYLLCDKKYYNFKNKLPHQITQEDVDSLIK
jgi:DNA topoisomerase-1